MAEYDTLRAEMTFDKLLEYVTEYDIFSYYLGHNFQIGSVFNSPFREDKKPSFSIFRSDNFNILLYKDFATGNTGDCIEFVRLVLNLTRKAAIKQVYEDLILNKKVNKITPIEKEPKRTSNKSIEISKRDFNKYDLEYWGRFGITKKTLNKFNVNPINSYWVNGTLSPYTYRIIDPAYAYRIFDKYKIYRPFSVDYKFISNATSYDLFGWEQLPKHNETIVITKSLKDLMVLDIHGVTAIAVQGEGHTIPKEILNELHNRFNKIIIFYDRDKAGLSCTRKLVKKYGFDFRFIHKKYKVKDIAELREKYGKEETEKAIQILFQV